MANLLKIIYNFQEINRSFIDKVGGKGANLGELTQLGVPVPPGFVVSSDAYFYFLDMSNIREKITRILSNLDIEDNIALNKASSEIEETIIKGKLPPIIEHDVIKAYSKLSGFSDTLVAVRSSATAEDLPDQSFAGQQSTFLNIKGKREVLLALKAAWASLFEPRAIYYRQTKGFDHMKIGIAVPIQRMVQSEVSGVIFTVDPIKNDVSKITIESVLGLGEAIVGGELTPDHYVLDKESLSIVQKSIAPQSWMLVRRPNSKNINDLNHKVPVPKKWQNSQKLDDRSLVTLANIGKVVEAHYGYPQDMEWAVEKGKLWVVQSRPITTIHLTDLDKQFEEKIAEEVKDAQEEQHKIIPDLTEGTLSQVINLSPPAQPDLSSPHPLYNRIAEEEKVIEMPETIEKEIIQEDKAIEIKKDVKVGKIIVTGAPASIGIISGRVRVILDPSDMNELQEGEILVTTMTNPNWIPVIKKAGAIVTDQGGMTSHAAIVSREMGIPAVVGTQIATKVLKTGDSIFIDGGKGSIYEVESEENAFEEKPNAIVEISKEEHIHQQPIESSVELFKDITPSEKIEVHEYKRIKTATKVYVNLAEPELAEQIAQRDTDGVGILRSEFMISNIGIHPSQIIEEKKEKEFAANLAENIETICKAFKDRPVIYKAADFKTNEYRALKGGEDFEIAEENPIIGFRGAYRNITNPQLFSLELEAIKIVRNKMGHKNLSILIPFVRTLDELRQIKKLISSSDLKRSSTFKLLMMVEVPSNVILIDEFIKIGIDGIVFGSGTLAQLILGLDRDNSKVQSEFSYSNEALVWAYKKVIKACLKNKIVSSFETRDASDNPELLKEFIKYGISSMTVNSDAIEKTREDISNIEKELILKRRRA